jgi:UDP-glucose 4-epimerase
MKKIRSKNGEGKSILVTGGAGFIGSHLVGKLLESGYRVTVFDNLQTGSWKNIIRFKENQYFKFIDGDVNLMKDILTAFREKYCYVYHYAASVGVERTLSRPTEVLADIDGLRNILALSVANGVKRFFYSSSSEVYGEPVSFPQNEEVTPLNSKLPYAVVKNLGGVFLKTYQKQYGLNYTLFRFFNTYGPGQSEHFVVSKFICLALLGKDITIYGDGKQTRSFIFVDDNVEATVRAISRRQSVNQTINVGSDIEIPILSLAKKIIRLTNSKSKIVHLASLEEGDMRRRCPDISLMKKILRIRPKVSLDRGLRQTIEYFKLKSKNE